LQQRAQLRHSGSADPMAGDARLAARFHSIPPLGKRDDLSGQRTGAGESSRGWSELSPTMCRGVDWSETFSPRFGGSKSEGERGDGMGGNPNTILYVDTTGGWATTCCGQAGNVFTD